MERANTNDLQQTVMAESNLQDVATIVANLYPFNYSGKTDPHGFYVGRDKFGSNVLVDFNQRAEDRNNGSILILGNFGQGKSYLL